MFEPKDSADRPSSCLQRRSTPKQICEEDSSLGVCSSTVRATGMAGSEARSSSTSRVQEFITYYEETWLVGNYPLPLWNVFESGSVCTNNHVEGWHSRLKVVGKAHPNIFEIVEVFKEQASTEVSLAQLSAGAAPPRHRRRVL